MCIDGFVYRLYVQAVCVLVFFKYFGCGDRICRSRWWLFPLATWKLGIIDVVDGVCRNIVFFSLAAALSTVVRSFECMIGLSFALVAVPGRICSSA